MIEKIENKIEAYINVILDKDVIDYSDYQVLSGELARLYTKEKEAKLEAENKAQREKWLETLTSMVASK